MMLSLAARRHGGCRIAGRMTTALFPSSTSSRGAKTSVAAGVVAGLYRQKTPSLLVNNKSVVVSVWHNTSVVWFSNTSSSRRDGGGDRAPPLDSNLQQQQDETTAYDAGGTSNKQCLRSTVIQDDLGGIKEPSSSSSSSKQHDDSNNQSQQHGGGGCGGGGSETIVVVEPPVRHPRYHATPQMSRFGSLYHPLKAFHIARQIDLVKVWNLLEGGRLGGAFAGTGAGNTDGSSGSGDTIKKKFFGKNSLVIQLPSSTPTMMTHSSLKNGSSSSSSSNNTTTSHEPPLRYMAVFRFGSVVFLNVSPRQVGSLVHEIKTKCSMEPVASRLEKRENFGVMVSPAAMLAQQQRRSQQQQQHHQRPLRLQQQQQAQSRGGRPVQGSSNYSKATTTLQQGQYVSDQLPTAVDEEPDVVVTGDYCIVPDLDLNGVAVISNILAQTVAMDSYNEKVDEMLNQFEAINSTVIHTGSLPNTEKSFLFKTVAENNAIFIDMIRKIKLKDRSETAWTITKHERIHYALKAEFEIDDRFDQIDFKLNLIQQNAKFFLEVLQSQKSNSLEWCIVILILLECCIMSIDMSGMGPGLYEYISSWISWPTTTTVTPAPQIPPTTPTA